LTLNQVKSGLTRKELPVSSQYQWESIATSDQDYASSKKSECYDRIIL